MKCAIYIRVSTQRQREKFSLPAQRKILTDYAKSKGWSYVVYDEGAGSGETIENRPQILRLLQDAKDRKFQVCLVIELERLSRDEDLLDWLTIKKTFRDNKIKIATPAQTYDLEDDEDDFLSDLFGALAKREKKKLLKRMKRGSLEAVTKGVYIGNHFRLGYRYDKTVKNLVVDPEEAEIVKLIFKLCNEDNLGTVKIAEYLNSRRIPAPLEFAQKKGILKKDSKLKIGSWTGGVVWRILTNPIYYGLYHYNKVEHKNQKVIGKRPEKEWVKMTVEPIITYEDFEWAQENIKNRAKWSDRNRKAEYLLSGLLYCGECESKLQGITFKAFEKRDDRGKLIRKRWKDQVYYKCYGRVKKGCVLPYFRVKKIDAIVWEAMKELVEQPQKVLDNVIRIKQKELRENKETIPTKLKELEKELDKLNTAEDRLLDAYSMGDLEQADLKKQMPKIKFRKSRVQAEIDSLKLQLVSSKEREEKLSNLYGIKNRINSCDFHKKREFLRDAVDKVIIYKKGNIDIITVLDSALRGQPKLVCSESGQRSILLARQGRFSSE